MDHSTGILSTGIVLNVLHMSLGCLGGEVHDTSLGGIYTVMSLFCYLPAVQLRMREGTVLWKYEWEDKVNFTSDAWGCQHC